MINRIIEVLMVFLVLLVITLFALDYFIDNANLKINSIDKEKMLAMEEDVKRVEKEVEERKKKRRRTKEDRRRKKEKRRRKKKSNYL